MKAWAFPAVILVLLFVLIAAPASADPTLFGPTGLIRVPDAETVAPGGLQFSGQYAEDAATTLGADIGVTDRFELSPTWVNPEHGSSNLVLSAKLRLAQDPAQKTKLAVGLFDVTDEYNRTFFVVGQRQVLVGNTDVKAVLGWGEHNSLVDGLFAGAEFPLGKGYRVLTEYDGSKLNAALQWPLVPKVTARAGWVDSGLYLAATYDVR